MTNWYNCFIFFFFSVYEPGKAMEAACQVAFEACLNWFPGSLEGQRKWTHPKSKKKLSKYLNTGIYNINIIFSSSK